MYSVIIPCYRSAQTIETVVDSTIEEMNKMGCTELEFVLVNDCSPDNGKTLQKLRELAERHSCVKVIDLAKNVGQHNAVMAGLRNASGDVIISMDDDMQTRPSELSKMFAVFEEGYDVVYGCYSEKKESLFRRFGSWFNSVCVAYCLQKPKEITSSSFWIMRKFVKDSIVEYEGSHTYLLGLILRTTHHIKSVEVQHFEREIGTSGYTLKSLMELWSNIIGFSARPLHLAMNLGYLLAGGSFFGIMVVIIKKIMKPSLTVGWASTIIAVFFSLGVILIFMGLIGEYVGRTYLHINKEPQYVIREKINFQEK
ncbi:MAG: glycosyltransferase family 2 protein [Lachnospiraceae bacterium]